MFLSGVSCYAGDPFRDEEGFTTLGMVIALLVTLSLIFSSAQVYRIHSAAADIQDVADAAALAAENEVAEFEIIVRVCDAVVLSLSLASAVTTGLGVAALCTPVTAGVSATLLSAGKQLYEARNSFAEHAASGLNTLQKALPFLAAANAAAVAAKNNGGSMGAEYLALAVLTPTEGKEITVGVSSALENFTDDVDKTKEDLSNAAEKAEEAAEKANEAKEKAFNADCGNNPDYCCYQRALTLAGLSGSSNPLYHSVDAWSFSVALERSRAYYRARRDQEQFSESDSVEDKVRSIMRKKFYEYAVQELESAYVNDDGTTFDAYFPLFPSKTDEMRQTTLYTDAAYPISLNADGSYTMHAWEGCPACGEVFSYGSISQMESENYPNCETCKFRAKTQGWVGSASTNIENGYEHHYRIIAEAAEEYEQARNDLDPAAKEVKDTANSLFERLKDAFEGIASMRIDAKPPGSLGVVVLIANTAIAPASTGFETSFVQEGGTLGVRAAVSGATLVEESAGEAGSVIASFLDGFSEQAGGATGVLGNVLGAWSALLQAYAQGQDALTSALGFLDSGLSFTSASGLGTWAAGCFEDTVSAVGLEPADLDALKPVIVNTGYVTEPDTESTFSVRYLSVKRTALKTSGSTTDVFSSVVTDIETTAIEQLREAGSAIEVASIEPLGSSGPSYSLTITLPSAVTNSAEEMISQAADALGHLYSKLSGVRVWE